MRRTVLLTMVILAAAATAMIAAQRGDAGSTEPPDVALKTAINLELTSGDVTGAIARYRQIVDRYREAAPAVAARALVLLAASYDRLGRPEAREAYEEVLRVFPGQQDAVSIARTKLRVSAGAAQAGAGVTLRALPKSDGLPGTVSLDGRFLSFTSWSDGEVHVRDLRTGADRAITQRKDFNVGISALSKDGTMVAYQAFSGGCAGGPGAVAALCLVSFGDSAGSPAKVLVQSAEIFEVAPMDWSPDGRLIAVSVRRQDRTAQIGLFNIADSSLRVLQSVDWRGPTRIIFSPDGGTLAYDLPVSDGTDDRHIMTLAADGARGGPVVEHASLNIAMGWTPDGDALLFASDRGGTMSLWSQPLATGRPRGGPRLVRSGLNGSWSSGLTRDGALYFGVMNSDRDISVVSLDLAAGRQQGSATRLLRRFVGTNSQPEWSADGRYLAYISQRGFNISNNVGRIIGIHDVNTGEDRELRPKLLYFGALSWSPAGDALMTSGIDIKGREGVFRIDGRTGDMSLVVEVKSDAFPRWSADGRHVYYRKGERAQYSDFALVDRDLATGGERTIARGGFGVFAVSPDGRYIAAPLDGLQGAAAKAVVEIRVDTGEMRDLLRAAPGERIPPYAAPRWTPEGSAIILRKRSPNEMWLVPTAGGPPRKLDVDVHDWAFGTIGQISIHPDGRRVAFLSGNWSNEVMVLENFLPASGSSR